MWGPTASCPACAKHLKPHCPSKSCPWGRCGVCGVTWDRMARSLGNAAS